MSQYQPPQSPYPQQDYGPPQPLQWQPQPPQPLPPQQQWQQSPSQPLPPQEQWQTPPQWQQPIYQQPIYQQPPRKPRKSRKRLYIIVAAIVIVLAIIIGATSQGGNSAPSKSNTQATQPAQQQSTQSGSKPTQAAQQPTSQPTPSANTVGAPVVVSDTWTVTVNSVKTSVGDDITAPKSGDTFIIVDVTLKNTSSSNQDVSSLGMFNFKDSTGQQYTETITDFTKAPDGTIAPGELLRGQLVYEVPTSQHSFTFSFQSDLTGSDLTEWNLSI